jgi:L-2-hydroxyglutarate oxidase LhgO
VNKIQLCTECGLDSITIEVKTCPVCGKLLCAICFEENHRLPALLEEVKNLKLNVKRMKAHLEDKKKMKQINLEIH